MAYYSIQHGTIRALGCNICWSKNDLFHILRGVIIKTTVPCTNLLTLILFKLC